MEFKDITHVKNIDTGYIYEIISADFINKTIVAWSPLGGFIHGSLDKFEII